MTTKAGPFDYEVAIIGGGSAGYAAARKAAGFGLKVVVVEGGKEVGGLCILRGCMPTKALLYAAEVLHTAKKGVLWGLSPGDISFDFRRVMERKARMVSEFAHYREQQLSSGKFDFIRSEATFSDPHTIKLSDGRPLTAAHFIISTGSRVAPAPIPGLSQAGYMTSDDAVILDELPKSLVILGGGAVAVEFAQFFSRFGVAVTLVQRSPHILRDFDPDASAALETALMREGITLYTGATIERAWSHSGKKGVSFLWQNREVEAAGEEIFHGLGRVANTDALGLERAGVASARGKIETNSRMQTSAPHIYAAGDCAGRHEIVHIAIQQGEIAAWNIARPETPHEIDDRLHLQIVFTEPQMAAVGLTESAARQRETPFVSASYPFADHGKSMLLEALDGFVKLLADPKSGEILGGCAVGPQGGELIHEIVAAMAKRMTVQELALLPHYHPTLAEIWTYPAEELAEKIRLKPQN